MGLAETYGENAMLLFDDTKALEKALGTEAAAVLARTFEKADEKWRGELATKADLAAGLAEVRNEIAATKLELVNLIAATKHDILKWVFGISLAQSALLIAVMAFLK
jgi:hypothetical protein